MKNDNLIFSQAISSIKFKSLNNATVFKSTIVDLNVFKFSKKIRILSRRRSDLNEQSFFIYNVNAESFDLLVRQRKIQIFVMFMKNIDQQFQFDVKNQMKSINLSNVEIAAVNLQNIKKKLFFEYHDYLDVFDRAHVNQFFSH